MKIGILYVAIHCAVSICMADLMKNNVFARVHTLIRINDTVANIMFSALLSDV